MLLRRRRFLGGFGLGLISSIAASFGFQNTLRAKPNHTETFPTPQTGNEDSVVLINTSVVSREVDGETTLIDVDRDRLVKLNAFGKNIWDSLTTRPRTISSLIYAHSTNTGISSEAASFQVVSFLTDLRELGFCYFKLSSEKELAPLLDSPLDASLIAFSGGRRYGRSASACKTACT